MIRRRFLQSVLTGAAATSCECATSAERGTADVMTVGGPIPADSLGVTLPHEHVMVDFVGADQASRDRYSADEVFRVALPQLKRIRELGCQTLFECTPAFLGRDPLLLKRLSEASGVRLVTNCGYYGAAKDKFVPAHALKETAEQLAARWIGEWREGIEGTGIRPGFIKIGVDAGGLSEIDRKLVRAAAKTHLATGLAIASHTGDGAAALGQLAVLREEGVAATAFIWVHAQNERDPAVHERAAREGAWASFDGIGPKSVARHVEAVRAMKERGLLPRVLISQDAGWYHVGEPGGGTFRPYDFLFTDFLPALKKAGFTDDNIGQLTVTNPGEAFAVCVRPKSRKRA